MKKNKFNKKTITYFIIILLINILTNYECILSIFNKTEPIIFNNIEELLILNNEMEINNINKEINLIEINFERIPNFITIDYTNNNFINYKHINKSYANNNITNNKLIIPVGINGEIKNIKFNIFEGEVKNIILNPNIKFKFNILINIITILIIAIIIYIKRNRQVIKEIFTINKRINFNRTKDKTIIFITLVIITNICVYYYIDHTENRYTFGDMYEYYYTNAVMNGKLSLDYPVDEKLMQSNNPYDTSNRNFNYLWDASYYKGKYYCYFGILPILSIFIPHKIITGKYLTTPQGCLIYTILGLITTYLIFEKIIKKYFKEIDIITYTLSFVFIVLGSKLLLCMHRPGFYELVSLAAYFHVTLGINLTLFTNNKKKNLIGYTSLALAVLCRPTSLLCSILILPKIINKIKKKDFKIIDAIILIIPYLTVGLFTMYINYIRFDSIFEFGITYQLTTNNLQSTNISLVNIIYGMFTYLFGKIYIIPPFKINSLTENIPILTDYNVEHIGGGIITTSVIGVIIFFMPKIFKFIKEKELKKYLLLLLSLATILLLLSSGINALIGRYMLDFNYIYYTIMVILSLYTLKKYKNKKYKIIYILLISTSIIINYILSTTNI